MPWNALYLLQFGASIPQYFAVQFFTNVMGPAENRPLKVCGDKAVELH